jgi:small subunit ribosomal protein S9
MAESKIQAVGRRKTSVARVLLRPGKGEWSVNGRPLADYFPRPTHQIRVTEPLRVVGVEGVFAWGSPGPWRSMTRSTVRP